MYCPSPGVNSLNSFLGLRNPCTFFALIKLEPGDETKSGDILIGASFDALIEPALATATTSMLDVIGDRRSRLGPLSSSQGRYSIRRLPASGKTFRALKRSTTTLAGSYLRPHVSKSFASELPSIDGRIIWPCIASVSAKGSTKIIALPPASKYWSIENSVFSDVFFG